MRITIEKAISELEKQVYYFYVDTGIGMPDKIKIEFQEYFLMKRKTKRHKYNVEREYSRNYTQRYGKNMKIEDVPGLEELKPEIKKRILDSIEFKF